MAIKGIGMVEAIDIALDAMAGSGWVIRHVSEEIPKAAHLYLKNELEPSWFIIFYPSIPGIICSGHLIIVSKRTGQILYNNSTGDEG